MREHYYKVLPVKVAILILYFYLSLGAFILMEQTGWTYIEAFYYLQTVFTTTGFGDFDAWVIIQQFITKFLYFFNKIKEVRLIHTNTNESIILIVCITENFFPLKFLLNE